MAKKQIQRLKWDDASEVLTITYPIIGKEVVIDTRKFPAANRSYAQRHGYHQVFGDCESGDKTGAAKYDAVIAKRDHYENGGEWKMQGERDTLAELIEAVHKVVPGFTLEQLRLAAEEEPDQVADWREDARVRNEVAKARAKKAAERAKQAPKQELVIRGLK